MRADFYLAADTGMAWLDWSTKGQNLGALTLSGAHIDSHRSLVERFGLEVGWHFARWVSVQASGFECGGTSNTTLNVVEWRFVQPAGIPGPPVLLPLQRAVIGAPLHRRISGFGLGPRFDWQVSPTLGCYTRQNIVRLAEKDWGYYSIIDVGNDPGGSIWGYPQPPYEFNYHKVCYEPSVGIEWSWPARPRWSVGAEAAYLSSSLVKVASAQVRASLIF